MITMLKPVVTLAAAGVIGVALWKILSILLLPLAGLVLGLVVTLVKVGLLVSLVMFAVWLFRRKEKGGEASAG